MCPGLLNSRQTPSVKSRASDSYMFGSLLWEMFECPWERHADGSSVCVPWGDVVPSTLEPKQQLERVRLLVGRGWCSGRS